MSKSTWFLDFVKREKSYLAVIFLQFGYAGSALIAKTALNQGMSHYAFSVYRNCIAAACFAPFALFFERKVRPKMTFSIFWKIIMLALLEPVIDQNLYYTGMKFTSATFATAMCNVLPAITFLFAWLLRIEKVNIRSIRSQAKIVGTVVTVGGATIMTLLRGPPIKLPWTTEQPSVHSTTSTNHDDPIKGGAMIGAGCVCWASFYILQSITLKSYPAGLSLTSLVCLVGALLGTVIGLIMERHNSAAWDINWDAKLLSYVYSGIFSSGIAYYVSGVIMRDKGPVFVTAFNPLNMVIVATLSSFILSEQLDFGRVLGAGVIVTGLYLVIWGKGKDQTPSNPSTDQVTPIDLTSPAINPSTKPSIVEVTNVTRAGNGADAV